MPKKILCVIIIALLTLLLWIYRSSNNEYNSTILILTNNNYFKHTLIKPKLQQCVSESPFLLILVTSYVGHVELRSAHRRAMPADQLASLNISRTFLLAKIPPNDRFITQEAIKDESDVFGDILQGSFYENYRNLTYKHLMGLEWAARECSKVSYILKVDDDTVFNLLKTYDFLKTLPKNDDLIMGYILNNTLPKRDKQNKWYVTYEEYPRSIYPPYLSGWYYIISPKVASLICDEAMYNSFFWIDDIFITGLLLESLGFKLKQLPDKYWLEYYEQLECCLRDMINKSIRCDYVIGPNGGRDNLIVEFNEAYAKCERWHNCTVRLADTDMKKDCIVKKERTIFGNGQSEVHNIKL